MGELYHVASVGEWCGPSAVAHLAEVPYAVAVRVLARVRRANARGPLRGRSAIIDAPADSRRYEGVTVRECLQALRCLGMHVEDVSPRTSSGRRAVRTFGRWLEAEAHDGRYLVSISDHVFALFGTEIRENWNANHEWKYDAYDHYQDRTIQGGVYLVT